MVICNMNKLFLFLIIINCCACSGKLYNRFEWWLGENGIERYYHIILFYEENGTIFRISKEGFQDAMDVLYHKYPETHISLVILQQMEKTDTVLRLERPSLKTLQYSSQENYSKLASRDSIPVQDGILRGYWNVYRLKSPSTNNVFVYTQAHGGLLCVHIASNDYRPVYIKDLTFAKERALEKEFETELLPKIVESLEKIKYLHKHRIWQEDLE